MGKQMTIRKEIELLRQNFIFYLAGIFMILGIKYYYRQADCDSLLWILAPTVRWVEFLSRIPFTYISGTGYVNHSLRLLIASSCSGVRFMTITFATLVFSFVHLITSSQKSSVPDSVQTLCRDAMKAGVFHVKAQAIGKGLGWIAVSAFLSWLFTVFVNGLRIIIAIYLPLYLENAGLMKGILTQDRLHTMIGVAVYFIALLTIYRLVGWFVQRAVKPAFMDGEKYAHIQDSADIYPDACKKDSLLIFLRKCASPVFWYFILTLGLPFLNRANRDGATEFTEFVVLVTGCCALILLPYAIMLFLRRQK